jgi:hypothetical protein
MRLHKGAFKRYVTGLAKRIMSVTGTALQSLDEATADDVEPAFGGRP